MKLLTGLIQLIESPSGLFSLLCLVIMTILTLKVPGFGYAPWVAFFGIVPAILAFCEHKETMAQMMSPPSPPDKGSI